KQMYGSDAQHSAEPEQFRDLVKGIRAIEAMLANPVDKNDNSDYKEMKQIFEKSVVAACDIAKDTTVTRDMLCYKKPGTGIPAYQFESVLGKKAKRAINSNELIQTSDLI